MSRYVACIIHGTSHIWITRTLQDIAADVLLGVLMARLHIQSLALAFAKIPGNSM
jgi:hypothetical protein